MRQEGQLESVVDYAVQGANPSVWPLVERWRRCSLTTRFTVVAAVVVGIGMAVLGSWVSAKIEASVIANTASAAALYMDRFIDPYVQDLSGGQTLTPASQKSLTDLVQTRSFGEHIVEIKIWRADGTIIFSNPPGLIGMRPALSDSVKTALQGAVAFEFDDLDQEENVLERQWKVPLLEIYSPIRDARTGRVIAVAEFYQLGETLKRQLDVAQWQGVLIVGGLSLLMLAALIGIVRTGSATISIQQSALNDRIADLSRSISINEELNQRVAEANRRASESNERFLRRVSAELHDGPVQLIGLVLLRLDGINAGTNTKEASRAGATLEIIRSALRDALSEIRSLSNGLALPEIENLTLPEALDLAISNHQLRSSTVVQATLASELPVLPLSIKTCIYRFVQEGLNNAFRHADGKGQRVEVGWDGRTITVEVSDKGPGICNGPKPARASGIGLAGMKDRIESLGGAMLIRSTENEGTTLFASFNITDK